MKGAKFLQRQGVARKESGEGGVVVLMNMSNQIHYLLLFIENPFFKLIRNYYYSNWLRFPRPVP